MCGKSLFYFSTPKFLTIRNVKVGIFNRFVQVLILGFILFDLLFNELYLKIEVPTGYTAFWAESGNLSHVQNSKNFSEITYCNNPNYNYAYDYDEWFYKDIKCINLPYAEMYQKGENEFFFLTHFTEYDINVKKCNSSTNSICINREKQDYFTVGAEVMKFDFDHFYTTTFEEGSNLYEEGNSNIDTFIKDKNGKELWHFKKGETISFNVSQWLKLAGVDLDTFNIGTPPSHPHPLVLNPEHAYKRVSGIEIIIKVNYYNYAGYDDSTCEINLIPNDGWSSKGSQIYYHQYPNITDMNDEYSYNDRYRYGIKFKFITNGLMGEFNINSLISHLVSGIVLINLSTAIVTYFLILFTGKYGKDFKEQKYSKSEIREKCYSEKYCKKSCICADSNINEDNENNEENKQQQIEGINEEIVIADHSNDLESNHSDINNVNDNDDEVETISQKINEIFENKERKESDGIQMKIIDKLEDTQKLRNRSKNSLGDDFKVTMI